jgi:hypothetical protein
LGRLEKFSVNPIKLYVSKDQTVEEIKNTPEEKYGWPSAKKYRLFDKNDVHDAADLIGHAPEDVQPEIRRNILRVARENGWMDALPETWQDEEKGDAVGTPTSRGRSGLLLSDESVCKTPSGTKAVFAVYAGTKWGMTRTRSLALSTAQELRGQVYKLEGASDETFDAPTFRAAATLVQDFAAGDTTNGNDFAVYKELHPDWRDEPYPHVGMNHWQLIGATVTDHKNHTIVSNENGTADIWRNKKIVGAATRPTEAQAIASAKLAVTKTSGGDAYESEADLRLLKAGGYPTEPQDPYNRKSPFSGEAETTMEDDTWHPTGDMFHVNARSYANECAQDLEAQSGMRHAVVAVVDSEGEHLEVYCKVSGGDSSFEDYESDLDVPTADLQNRKRQARFSAIAAKALEMGDETKSEVYKGHGLTYEPFKGKIRLHVSKLEGYVHKTKSMTVHPDMDEAERYGKSVVNGLVGVRGAAGGDAILAPIAIDRMDYKYPSEILLHPEIPIHDGQKEVKSPDKDDPEVYDVDAKVFLVWETDPGKLMYLVDGHHHLRQAKTATKFVTRKLVDGELVSVPALVPVRVLAEKDGWTLELVKQQGGAANFGGPLPVQAEMQGYQGDGLVITDPQHSGYYNSENQFKPISKEERETAQKEHFEDLRRALTSGHTWEENDPAGYEQDSLPPGTYDFDLGTGSLRFDEEAMDRDLELAAIGDGVMEEEDTFVSCGDDFEILALDAANPGGGIMRVKQKATRADSVNKNRRVYQSKVLKAAIDEARSMARAGAMLSEGFRHPEIVYTSEGEKYTNNPERITARVDDISPIDKYGWVYVTRTILDTPMGKQVADAYSKAKADANFKPPGISTRFKMKGHQAKIDGMMVHVADAMQIHTFDDVLNPAVDGAGEFSLLTDSQLEQAMTDDAPKLRFFKDTEGGVHSIHPNEPVLAAMQVFDKKPGQVGETSRQTIENALEKGSLSEIEEASVPKAARKAHNRFWGLGSDANEPIDIETPKFHDPSGEVEMAVNYNTSSPEPLTADDLPPVKIQAGKKGYTINGRAFVSHHAALAEANRLGYREAHIGKDTWNLGPHGWNMKHDMTDPLDAVYYDAETKNPKKPVPEETRDHNGWKLHYFSGPQTVGKTTFMITKPTVHATKTLKNGYEFSMPHWGESKENAFEKAKRWVDEHGGNMKYDAAYYGASDAKSEIELTYCPKCGNRLFDQDLDHKYCGACETFYPRTVKAPKSEKEDKAKAQSYREAEGDAVAERPNLEQAVLYAQEQQRKTGLSHQVRFEQRGGKNVYAVVADAEQHRWDLDKVRKALSNRETDEDADYWGRTSSGRSYAKVPYVTSEHSNSNNYAYHNGVVLLEQDKKGWKQTPIPFNSGMLASSYHPTKEEAVLQGMKKIDRYQATASPDERKRMGEDHPSFHTVWDSTNAVVADADDSTTYDFDGTPVRVVRA